MTKKDLLICALLFSVSATHAQGFFKKPAPSPASESAVSATTEPVAKPTTNPQVVAQEKPTAKKTVKVQSSATVNKDEKAKQQVSATVSVAPTASVANQPNRVLNTKQAQGLLEASNLLNRVATAFAKK